ncbi:MAG TPA: hypothetical protein VHY08_29960, partial [Bacillota bacterium]|nr:hypothetical protein [Bacillota bacterium]
ETIFVYNSTVYTAGSYYDGSNYKPCYWINTTAVPLTIPGSTVQGTAHAITVASDGAVYTAGECLNDSGSLTIPCYWQNNSALVDLSPAGTTIGSAYTIQISDGSIYVGGYYKDSNNYNKPCYWSGTSHPLSSTANKFSLPAGENNGIIVSLFVAGGNCYAAGSTSQACYWRSSGSNPLPISGAVTLNAIYVADGVVYIVGAQDDRACYWTDSGAGATANNLLLPDTISSAAANSIYVFEGTPYCVGVYNDGSKDIACYWSGNSRIDLPNGNLDSEAKAIFVEK